MGEVLELEHLFVELGGRNVLRDVSLSVPKGSFLALVGPNGAGKSTLLRTIYKGVPRAGGTVKLDGRSIDTLEQRDIGRIVGVLRQEAALSFDFLVEELVFMGRSPYKGLFSVDTAEDHAIVEEALLLTDVAHLRGRSFATLSGGEKQRVLLARALAQRPLVLLLDEPTNHLDIRHQIDVIARVKQLGLTVVAALHDLNMPMSFASSVALLVDGSIRAHGKPLDVLTPANIEAAFGVRVDRVETGDGGMVLVPTGLGRGTAGEGRRSPSLLDPT